MPVLVHAHVGASSPTKTDIIHGIVDTIKIQDRAGAATVDVDEASGLARKLVNLASGTTTTTVGTGGEMTDNTGSGLSTYLPQVVHGRLTVTSSENCTVMISYSVSA